MAGLQWGKALAAMAPEAPGLSRCRQTQLDFRSDRTSWELLLYIAGPTPRAQAALATLRRIGEDYLAGRYRITVIDVLHDPKRALREGIVALPTLIKAWPGPGCRLSGKLANLGRVMVGLGLQAC